jgi:hypothetical protein
MKTNRSLLIQQKWSCLVSIKIGNTEVISGDLMNVLRDIFNSTLCWF